jgi:hypothetical protein
MTPCSLAHSLIAPMPLLPPSPFPIDHSYRSQPISINGHRSKLPRLEINHPSILNHTVQTPHKLQMTRVLFQIILPVLFVLELGDEAVCEGALSDKTLANASGGV